MKAGDRMIIEEVVVEKFLNGGDGLAHGVEGKPLFVKGAYPGEIVDVKVLKDKKNYTVCEPVKWKYKIEERNMPVCKVFDRCGACDWLDLDYSVQLMHKRKIVEEQFERLGKMDVSDRIKDVLPSPEYYGFRNKMTYFFAPDGRDIILGLKEKGSSRVVEPRGCKVVPGSFDKIRVVVQKMFNELFSVEDIHSSKNRKGNLRGICLRKTQYTGQIMLIIITQERNFRPLTLIKTELQETLPFLDSVIHLNTKKKNLLSGLYNTVAGSGVITEHIDWFDYNIPPNAFFQVNAFMLKPMLEKTKEMLKPDKKRRLLDLYGGVGFFSIYLAPLYNEVVLVESHKDAVKTALANAGMNKIDNMRTEKLTVEKFTETEKMTNVHYDDVILDPPRAGVDPEVIDRIANARPERVLYTSCDLGTLVRDAKRLIEKGYRISEIQPLDMFPHTSHIENIIRFERV